MRLMLAINRFWRVGDEQIGRCWLLVSSFGERKRKLILFFFRCFCFALWDFVVPISPV